MVVVLPAGAQIPALRPLKGAASAHPKETGSGGVEPVLRDGVAHFVSCLDPDSACNVPIVTLNVESMLPAHLNQRPTPREVGLAKFTLHQGIVDKHHAFIDPGAVPRGFMHEAQFHAETHRIPVLDFLEPTEECRTVFKEIVDFIHPSNFVFTHLRSVSYSQECLNWIAKQAGVRRQVQVLPLETLAQELVLLVTQEISYTTRLTDELRPQILEHVTHFGCDYHASRDIPVCALSSSARQAVATHFFLQTYFSEQLTNVVNTSEESEVDTAKGALSRAFNRSNDDRTNQSEQLEQYPDQSEHLEQNHVTSEHFDQSPNQSENFAQCSDHYRHDIIHKSADDSSVFALPDMFQDNFGDNNSMSLSKRSESTSVSSNTYHPRRPRTSPISQTSEQYGGHGNLPTTKSLNPILSRGTSQTRDTSRDQKANPTISSVSTRKVGLGRGYLRQATGLPPPRRPNVK